MTWTSIEADEPIYSISRALLDTRLRLSSSKRRRRTEAGDSWSSDSDIALTLGSETLRSRFGGDWSEDMQLKKARHNIKKW